MRYFISDLHFYHEALNKRMDKRGFISAEDMNEYMIDRWNSRVRNKKDEVVILGDFSLSHVASETSAVLNRLNGRKILVRGNHDRYLSDTGFDSSLFEEIVDYREYSDNKRKVICCHYPIVCYNRQYSLDEGGNPRSYMLYGHVHNTYDEYLLDCFIKQTRSTNRSVYGKGDMSIPCNMINCFCMFSDYVPLTLDEWIDLDNKRRASIKKEDFLDTDEICE